jgi:hypothetical protein
VQINGLDAAAKQYDTWNGVRITADEVRDVAHGESLQLLALEGVRTQYMWTTMRKPYGTPREPAGSGRIRRITNAHNSEPVAPAAGRFASVTAWVEHLPEACDLLSLQVVIGGTPAVPCYIGPCEADGLQQLNVLLPPLQRTGLLPFELLWRGARLCPPVTLRVIPPGPSVPVLLSVTDGINMLSGTRIVTGFVKVTVEQTHHPESFRATVSGRPVENLDVFCADPLPPRWEINFHLPDNTGAGRHVLEMSLGRRPLPAALLDVAPNTA